MSSGPQRRAQRSPRLNFEQLEPRAMLSVADLSDFAGVGNTSAPNNYTEGLTAAGGTFDSRRFGTGEAAAYLADTVLNVSGGELTRTTAGGFGANGTLTFDASSNASIADPVFYFGFFDNEGLTAGAFGFSIANETATSFRFRSAAGTTQSSGSGIVVGDGTYAFDLDVNNAQSAGSKVRFRLVNSALVTVVDVSVNIPVGLTLSADSFGFLQPLAASDSDNTFSMSVSDINYTGETQVVVAPTLPAAPTNLNATASPGQVNLVWQDNSNNENGFTIERRVGAGAFAPLATVAIGMQNYADAGVAPETTYTYRVRAFNDVGVSDWSNEDSATTPELSNVTITATNYSRTQIYHSPQTPGWTSWAGGWIMPNGDLMASFARATGPVLLNGQPRDNYNYSGLDVDVVYLRGVRATDGSGNVAWTTVAESDVNFTTAEDSGLGTHANNGGTTIALTDGSLIRRVYGWDYQDYPELPGTTFMQRSTDGGLTWSAAPVSSDGGQTWSDPSPIQEFLLDPTSTTVQMTRTLRLSDGRLLIGGNVWNGLNTQSAPREPLLMVSSDEAVSWQRIPMTGADWTKFNEFDFEELANGDLFIVSRINVNNQSRWQGVMTKTGSTWQYNALTSSVLPHSGHPELLTTQEGPVLHIATTGTHWTTNAGQTWNVLDVDSLPDLATGDYRSQYYPDSLQTADGWVYVFGHRGFDNYYGQLDQAVFMDKFRLAAEGGPDPVLGDYNGDFEVDGEDLAVWKGSFGQPPAGTTNADGDEDGDIDGNDFLVWQRNLQPAAVAAAAPLSAIFAAESATVAAVESDLADASFAQLAGEGLPRQMSSPTTAFRRTNEAPRSAVEASAIRQVADERLLVRASERRAVERVRLIERAAKDSDALDAVFEFSGSFTRLATAMEIFGQKL